MISKAILPAVVALALSVTSFADQEPQPTPDGVDVRQVMSEWPDMENTGMVRFLYQEVANAASGGDSSALLAKGVFHIHGDKVPQSYRLGIESLVRAHDSGHPLATMILMNEASRLGSYFDEIGVSAEITPGSYSLPNDIYNADRAFVLNYYDAPEDQQSLISSLKKEQHDALFAESRALFMGLGQPVDRDAAIAILKEIAEEGYARAQFNLGNFYLSAEVLGIDHEKAERYYRSAAAQDYAPAIETMGSLYLTGDLFEANPTVAYEWFSKGVALEHAGSHYQIAVMHENGAVGDVDIPRSIEHYQAAAELGHEWAHYNLALAYSRLPGDERDLDTAIHWMKRALEVGVEWAGHGLARLHFARYSEDPVAHEEDILVAHAWINAFPNETPDDLVDIKAEIESTISPAQLLRAQDLAVDVFLGN